MKIIPKIKNRQGTVQFEDLADGDVFIFEGTNTGLFIKGADDEQTAMNLDDGSMTTQNCEASVVQVEATLSWKFLTKKKGKAK